ncbi:hypothetical protein [Deinococcus sedimenti]|uniref:Uncharacterized protein n=1 Tax=Deinococcus sedimenti TaxID=1867090 RepID=A0ABQ2S546_9DEIO|nr:hypothetical protein [Deinococcus sedimenti]GGR90159.1 hypothetical protein GCM10008960_16590 [Deinococcus sedimenti]
MAKGIWRRERHARRIAARRLSLQLRGFQFRQWTSPDVDQAWPRACWKRIGQFDEHWEAQVCASRHPGSRLITVRRTRKGRTRIICHRVGYVQRLGAPFRTAVMTWELEDIQRQHQDRLARRVLQDGGLRGGVAAATRKDRRRWRRAGREACRLALRGEIDRADDLDPQPRRLGVDWIL